MPANLANSFGVVLLASVMNAAYTMPMKLNRRWKWEHSWFAFTLCGVVVVPTLMAMLLVPGLWSVYAGVSVATLAAMALFGSLWGVSMVFFGLAVPAVGVAITFSVSLGTSAAMGAFIPLILQHAERILTRQGLFLFAGMAGVLLGVGLYGAAGVRRERAAGAEAGQRRFLRGFSMAFISGLLGSLLNVGLSSGTGIQRQTLAHGARLEWSSAAVWLPCIYAGAVPGLIYCLYLMKRNGVASQLAAAARWYYWLAAAAMGALWFGSIVLYGMAVVWLGDLGPVIGWPLFMSAIVVASTVLGALNGEWSNAGRSAVRMMLAAVSALVLAMAVLSQAGR